MPLVDAKCPNCGGEIKLDDNMTKGFCLHCGSQLMVQEVVRKVNIEGEVNVKGVAPVENLIKLLYRDMEAGRYNTEEFDDRYRRALELDPDNEELQKMSHYLVLGDTLLRINRSGDTFRVPDGVLKINPGTFQEFEKNNNNLKKVVFPKDFKIISKSMFKGCKKILEVELPTSLESIEEDAFYGCEALRLINIPDGLKFLGERAFYRCGSLETFTLPTQIEDVPDGLLALCINLKEVNFHPSVKIIGNSAFNGCKHLSSIDFPVGLESIGSKAFMACDSLKKIATNEGIKIIGDYAFSYCKSLKSATISHSIQVLGTEIFDYDPLLKEIWIHNGNIDIETFGRFEHLICFHIPRGSKLWHIIKQEAKDNSFIKMTSI